MHPIRLPRPLLLMLLLALAGLALAGCDSGGNATPTPIAPTTTPVPPTITPAPSPTSTTVSTPTATPIPVSKRGFVPIMCYHHIRDWLKSDTEDDRAYIVPPAKLEAQLKWLKAEGYTGVTSKQVYEYYAFGRPLPDKPIMLSFDDNDDNQYTNARPLLKKYGFTASFFIMTVTLGQENYMTPEQLKTLDSEGFDIQPHTWDHHMVTGYKSDDDWETQIAGPKKTLEELLGHETPFFAYPFGIYDGKAAMKLKEYGYKGAFRLAEVMDDTVEPAYAIKRYIANGYWDLDTFELVTEGGWE